VLAIHPPSISPSMLPSGKPSETIASTSARRSAGKARATSAWPAGALPASAAATPPRASSKCMKFCAKPLSAVIRLQKASVSDSTIRELCRSATRASGSAATA